LISSIFPAEPPGVDRYTLQHLRPAPARDFRGGDFRARQPAPRGGACPTREAAPAQAAHSACPA